MPNPPFQKDPDASDNIDRVGCLSHQMAHRLRKSDVWALERFPPRLTAPTDWTSVRSAQEVRAKPRSIGKLYDHFEASKTAFQ